MLFDINLTLLRIYNQTQITRNLLIDKNGVYTIVVCNTKKAPCKTQPQRMILETYTTAQQLLYQPE